MDDSFVLSDEEVEVVVSKKKATKAKGGKKATKAKGKKKAVLKEKNTYSDDDDDFDMEMEEAPPRKDKRNSIEKAALSKRFQKKTQLEHIMLRPDTYIGSVEKITVPRWVWDEEDERLVNRNITYVPGLYKIFDEILVNAADNKQRDPSMKSIIVTIDKESGAISVQNDGKGIPIEMHRDHNVHIPELVFGHLLTGENFEDTQQRVVGGRNGYGAKLANIFSSHFQVETKDSRSGQIYCQDWRDNMSVCDKPKIKKAKGKDYTRVTFTPDYSRFGMPDGLDEDTYGLLVKRVYDIAGVTDRSIKVTLNGSVLPINTFEKYIDLYLKQKKTDMEDGEEPKKIPKIYEKINDRWEVCITPSQGQLEQVSFVNSICTMNGGQHVNFIADKIANKLTGTIKKKSKGMELKGYQIKSHLWVFVNCLIVNPAFDSQTKDTLTTISSKFGPAEFKPEMSDKTYKAVEKCGIVDNVVYWANAKKMKDLARKTGAKKTKVSGIDKLDDANNAGGRKSQDCTLILTEGDSAKTLAISGLSVVGRDNYGVFPLKGKLLNVRDAGHSQIMKNQEIQNICKIMGLQPGKKYESTKGLRYGHLMIMTDQDHDGSHIKGLLFNFIHHFWPDLLKVEGFLRVFITPIVKATKGKDVKTFHTMPEYEDWYKTVDASKWKIKYYKGLGTSTAKEAKEYFANIQKNQIDMYWEDDNSGKCIEMAFSKKKIKERKAWLTNFEPGTRMDFNVDQIDYKTFVNNELILFSIADNERSIPSIVDGLKPSQRKVLFGAFKRKLKQEIKVAQLAGYVSEHAMYHHGEMSLTSTIVGMAQTFVGSNNINWLYPSGQFGSRIMGGKDAASSRYIFTKLAMLTRYIFHEHDNAILENMEEDGDVIEPRFYIPVIPTVLVNGSTGIGTGYSTDIPMYNPRDLVEYLKCKVNGESTEDIEIKPWYRGFTGDVEEDTKPGRYVIRGVFERLGEEDNEEKNTLKITELPVGTWTTPYKQFLEDEKTFPPGQIKDLREHHTDVSVSFTIVMSDDLAAKVNTDAKLIKHFKLESMVSTQNMTAFDKDGKMKKYAHVHEIINEFYDIRLEAYGDRKQHLEQVLENEWLRLDNKSRFVFEAATGLISLLKRKKKDLEKELEDKKFFKDPQKGFDYLLSLPVYNLTMEKVEEMQAQRDKKKTELDILRKKTPEDLWFEDLDAFLKALDEQDVIDEKEAQLMLEQAQNSQKGKKTTRRRTKKKAAGEAKPKIKKSVKPEPEKVEEEILSLADRLKARMVVTPVLARKRPKESTPMQVDDDNVTDKITPAQKPKEKKVKRNTKAAAKTKPKETKAKKKVIKVESSDESESEVEVDVSEIKKRTPRARRGAASKKKAVYVFDSDDEEDEEEEAFSLEDDDDDEDY